MIELKGITWDHSRALPPLVAAAQRYEELNPRVSIRWEKRSLHAFGHMPIDQLAEHFDLIVIDHPWAGFCFERDLIHDLKPLLEPKELEAMAGDYIGPSWESYCYEDRLMALPIDAATPTPSWRPDLMQAMGRQPPRTMGELIDFASTGRVVMPGFAADLFLNWSMLVEALGKGAYASETEIVAKETGLAALRLLKELARHMPDDIYEWNPIRIAERMTSSDDFAYCPFAYSYSNYCRPEFTDRPLTYGSLVTLDDGRPLRSIVGGTGIAISQRCEAVAEALAFSRFCASAPIQQGIYTLAGGQPAHRAAWDDAELDQRCGGFFSAARQAQEACIVRPRYHGYVPLQESGGEPIQACLQGTLTECEALDQINQAYRASLSNR
jgi:multiple sugar transport system substrate-binding protein